MDDYRLIFINNLRHYLSAFNMTQVELANKLSINKSVVASWLSGARYPRMNTIERIASVFNIEKSDLIEDKTSINSGYYHDKEVAEIAEQLRTNPEGRILFDASRDLSKEDIDIVLGLINSLKAREKK